MGWEPLKHVLEVDPRGVPIQLGRVQEAHDDRRALTSKFASGEQPCLPAHRDWADLVFHPIVVCALLRSYP